MFESRAFWQVQGAATLAFHLLGLGFGLFSAAGFAHPLATLWLIVLGIHVLEVPIAFLALRGRNVSPPNVVLKTLLLGFVWWVPRRRGIYQR
ncbi:MAG: hypothetical protein SV108_04770 [Pseudomonadota bacterium]|jgi:hypothetical protein|nr:hypothetical protein [Pseudomonadota bacterium]HJO36381.1 hypothetical protein [Gammaproteobacteria bacterium]